MAIINDFFNKWIRLIAGAFIVIISTAYRGREPPIDDDDY
jgi:hypothetical protein